MISKTIPYVMIVNATYRLVMKTFMMKLRLILWFFEITKDEP